MLQMPQGDEVHSLCLSPDGKNLARVVWKDRIEKGRLLRSAIEIQVHRLDGSDKKIIGCITFPDSELRPEGPEALRWVPDGKHLSFLYKDALWTLPVD